MYEIEITKIFSAAHSLRNYQGNCSRIHGHNWVVKVVASRPDLDEIGIAVDFRRLKDELDRILASLDHSHLNEHPSFMETNPTSENIAAYIYREISAKINPGGAKIARVTVSESADSAATYYE